MLELENCPLCKQHLSKNEFVVCTQCRSKFNLNDEENNFINLFLTNSLKTYQSYNRAICMSSSAEAVIGHSRQILNNIIIEFYKNSQRPLDILAVAFTYTRMYATERPLAIKYFEKYLENPIQPPKIYHIAYEVFPYSIGKQTYSQWRIYSTLANLYEKEYMFEKSIDCLKKCIIADNGKNFADYIRIGDVLIKVDVNVAEQYYISLLNDNRLEKYKSEFTIALENVLNKKSKGYVYRPKRRKNT